MADHQTSANSQRVLVVVPVYGHHAMTHDLVAEVLTGAVDPEDARLRVKALTAAHPLYPSL